MGVATNAEVRNAGSAQTTLPPETDVGGREDGIGAFHAENVAERALIGMSGPLLQVGLNVAPCSKLAELALQFQIFVIANWPRAMADAMAWFLKSMFVIPRGLARASTVAMEMATSPRRISGSAPGIGCGLVRAFPAPSGGYRRRAGSNRGSS